MPDPLTTALGTFQNAPLYRLNYDYSLSPTVLLHFGAGYRSNYFLVPSVTTTGQITNYNALQQLGLKGGLEYKWFPTITGLSSPFVDPSAGGMKNIGSEAGTNSITQSPSFNTYTNWVKGQPYLQVWRGVSHSGISAAGRWQHARHLLLRAE